MSNVGNGETKFGGYALVALVTAGAVYALTSQSQPAAPPPLVATSIEPAAGSNAAPVATAVPMPMPTPLPPPVPAHFYDSHEGTTYYYGRAVSEEERKTGKRAPDMLAFRYLGRNDQGLDVLENVTSGGSADPNTCARPCKVIHQPDGKTIGFDTDSIIGAAFADAQRGYLKKFIVPKPKAEADYPWPNDPRVPAPDSSNR